MPLDLPKVVKYGSEGIRRELLKRNSEILKYSANIGKPKNGVVVIIKPSDKCNYRNLIDILDEMKIADIVTYTIVNNFTPVEAKLLAIN